MCFSAILFPEPVGGGGMIIRTVLFMLVVVSIGAGAYADDYAELVAYRDSLKQQIQTVDSEIARCEKSLKNWKTATIIGGVGAVASGIGIIVQNTQIQENKKTLNKMSSEAKNADAAIQFIQKVSE